MKEQEQTSIENQPSSPTGDDAPNELLVAENDRLRSELRLRSARDQMLSEFAKENARSPELLFQASASRFEFDDSGALTNTDTLITELRQNFPEQFVVDEPEKPPLVPSVFAGAGRGRPPQTLTKEALAAMSPQQIVSLDWNEVKQILSQ